MKRMKCLLICILIILRIFGVQVSAMSEEQTLRGYNNLIEPNIIEVSE